MTDPLVPQFPAAIESIIGKDVKFETRPGRFTDMNVLAVRWIDQSRGAYQFNLMRLSDRKSRWTTEYVL